MGIDIVGRREILNGKPFSYYSSNMTHFYASRCDFSSGVTVLRPKHISDAAFATDICEMTGYHCLNIRDEHLNGFAGYDVVRFEIKLMDSSDIHDISDRVMDANDSYDHYDVTGHERPENKETT